MKLSQVRRFEEVLDICALFIESKRLRITKFKMFAFLKNAKTLNMTWLRKEGNHVFTTRLKKEVTIVLIVTLLASALLVINWTPRVSASLTTIISLPASGKVKENVTLTGAIDTSNGIYRIFFDKELVKSGNASGTAVNTKFSVPHRFKGNYTVILNDLSKKTNDSRIFRLDTNPQIEALVPRQPKQLVEGQEVTIRVNITGGEVGKSYYANVGVMLPLGTTYYKFLTVNTTTGHPGELIADTIYPGDFGPDAHTNYTGTYFATLNTTIAIKSFQIGLTNATRYYRFGTVAIQAANYTTQPSEVALVNITCVSTKKTVLLRNVTADAGVVNAEWTIPWNATHGNYNVTVATSSSPGTIKPKRDTQIFAIDPITYQCWIQVKNLGNQTVSGVEVHAFKGKGCVPPSVDDDDSDSSGFAKFAIEASMYSFKAYYKNADVGSIYALNVSGNINQTIDCQLASIKLLITDKDENPLPSIVIDSNCYYTTVSGRNWDNRTLETDRNGTATFQNTFINASYLIEAKRYGYIFNRTIIENLTTTQWVNITCPVLTLFIHVLDSEGLPLTNVSINVTEWSSGILIGNMPWKTDNLGTASLNLTFGRYKVRAYNHSAELGGLVILNETTVDVVDRQLEILHCRIVNLTPQVFVMDYFGQPIPNAEIRIERFSEFKREWVEIASRRTDSNGVASLPRIGGEYSISVYIMGQLGSVKSFYIDESSTLVFKIDKYTTIGGLVLETTQLIVYIALGLLIISLVMALTYKKILQRFTKK